jgi:hypothetical protein
MTRELAPPLAAGAPPRLSARDLARALGAALAASAAFWSPLLLGGALHGHDWSTHHFHYFDWVRQSFTEYGAFPLYMADAWVTPNFLANAEAPTFGPLAWLLLFLPTGAYLKLLIVAFTAAGLAGFVLLLRDLGVSWPVAAALAAAFCFGGFFASHVAVGHPWALGAQLLPALLLLFRRAVLGSNAALAGGAALAAATVLGGQHQPFLWQNLLLGMFAALWALRVRAAFPLVRFVQLAVLAAGLAAVKLVPLWLEFLDYAPTARIQGLPLGALVGSLLIRGQGPDRIDPAITYAFGAGWWEYAFYSGPLVLVAAAAALVGWRRSWPLLAAGVFFLVLSIGARGPWGLLQDLPVWRSQRCPSRFLVLALFAFLVAAGPPLQALLARAQQRLRGRAAVLAWGVALLVAADLFAESLAWQAAAVGPAIASRDHRPVPVSLDGPAARVSLTGFAPNHLVYAVEAQAPATVVLPVRWGQHSLEWRVEGASASEARGRLAIGVEPGRREVKLAYAPPGLWAGALISAATLAVLAFWAGRGWRSAR